METINVSQNVIYWEIKRGVSQHTSIYKSDGWGMFDEIVMDFKLKKDINYPAELRLTVGNGITIDGNDLIVSLTYEQTADFRVRNMYADIKLKIGTEVIDPIPYVINIVDTVTKLDS